MPKKISWDGNYTYHLFEEFILLKNCVEMLDLTELTLMEDQNSSGQKSQR
jgi:hypothetical protein